MSEEKKHKHSRVHRSEHEHHADGSVTSKFHQEDGGLHPASGASADLDGMQDRIHAALGTQNPGEAEADAGQSGIPGAVAPGIAAGA